MNQKEEVKKVQENESLEEYKMLSNEFDYEELK